MFRRLALMGFIVLCTVIDTSCSEWQQRQKHRILKPGNTGSMTSSNYLPTRESRQRKKRQKKRRDRTRALCNQSPEPVVQRQSPVEIPIVVIPQRITPALIAATQRKAFSRYLEYERKRVVEDSQSGNFDLNYWIDKTQNIPPIFPYVSKEDKDSAIGLHTFLLLDAVANK